jgi:hypothetical protein
VTSAKQKKTTTTAQPKDAVSEACSASIAQKEAYASLNSHVGQKGATF